MLMLEVWLDNQSSSASLHVKVVCYVDKDQAKEVGMATFALSEVLSSNQMPFSRWTHVVVSFSHKSEMTEVQIFLNTHPTKKLVITLKSIALKLQQQAKQIQAEMCKQSITIGHVDERMEKGFGGYSLGRSVLVFNSLAVDEASALSLYLLGPDCNRSGH